MARDNGVNSRRLALEALVRVETSGAFVNLALPHILQRSELSKPDRAFVTNMVYGTVRMQRACDYLIDQFRRGDVEPIAQAALRVGTYQLKWLNTPPHAAIDTTVSAVPKRCRSVVNAILRRISELDLTMVAYPSLAMELSYPDWVVDSITTMLGPDEAELALRAMNQDATTVTRSDGYRQDLASQLVTEVVDANDGHLVVDLCAAPGGKATGLAALGATVIAGDKRPKRAKLVAKNARRLGYEVPTVMADATAPPIRAGVADRVLVDAPCSGLGSLKRRPDARWNIDEAAPARLSKLQTDMVLAGVELLRPGGELTYSVCTLTREETVDVLARVREQLPVDVTVMEPEVTPWAEIEGVSVLTPDETDAIAVFRLRRDR